MKKSILFNATPTEKRGALLEDGKVVELVIERPDQYRIVGNIYRGRISSILPGIQSAFIDCGLERAAFLHASDVDPSLLLDKDDDIMEKFTADAKSKRRRIAKVPIEKVLEKGQEIIVQVAKEPIGSKGAKMTTQISIAGRFLVLVPDTDFIGVSKRSSDDRRRRELKRLISAMKPPGIGFIVRTIGLKVSQEEFINEINALLAAWKKVRDEALLGSGPRLLYREMGITTSVIRDLFAEDVTEVVADNHDDFVEIQKYLKAVHPSLCDRVKHYTDREPLFDRFNIEKDLERSLRRKVWLKSGGYILFDHAEALLAIDVNTGRNVGKADVEDTIFRTNMEAADEICRQLRLRDIGGLIVVDFIDMAKADHRRQVEDRMRRIMHSDQTSTAMTGLSKFGLMEITRKRVRPELRELYTDACPTCNGLGWVFTPASISTRIDRALRKSGAQDGGRRLSLTVHSTVAEYLRRDNGQMVKKLEQEHGVFLDIQEDPELDFDEFSFSGRNGGRPQSQKQ